MKLGLLLSMLALGVSQAETADRRLIGVWSTVTYRIQGKDYPMDGLFIFTERHFAASAFFKVSGGALDDLNANAGTYRTEGDQLIFLQQVQAHIRPGDPREPIFYGKGVEEAAIYRLEGKRLIITFPSQNRYVLERIDEQP